MLHIAVPHAKYTLVRTGDLSIFTFQRYDVKVMFLRNAFLVDTVTESIGRVLRLDSIETGDIWDFIEDGSNRYRDMNRLVAYEKGLKTWSKWVDENIDTNKTMLFFQGVSPDHLNGAKWGQAGAKYCEGQMRPVSGLNYPGGAHPAELVLEKVLRSMSKPIYLLNITTLSQLRKDGHPSVYGHGGHNDMDCSHWCLPGVPDTWNLLLYASLLHNYAL
ncbi:hypothetical protein TanjilG_29637 [Lupinus angustifolius]|uniref:Trichome birefringence-like C-terminal domain-containing protein n=1 Tax=Lupinus angustifolius TaxID=3871 RepID=A0A4P1R6B3_LUPAN|nr:hypothetical protein TanjilG_29637 [Lupinus angustifolius]